ncbi:hypothetical protein C8E03_11441 [Lachnotalea glycerini]|jgi:hypothetical protein|uniref:GRAM domain-containing protein n=1 Tax=Lachnotalea glycerini TaxID=1763509 RepID=A0A318EN27_9FIRM|nr:hypothetical protein [Lachnotalea glycerini]OYP33781.1 hypothetical protein CG709_06455 [Lachnotalea glycerini]PXV85964.1 hypothetical protein C8E03_11441 [Lachnotalea glycerini]
MVTDRKDNIILKSQGTIERRSAWQIGHLYLTGNNLYFMQMNKCLFEIGLDRIIKICIIKKTWLLGCKVKQLCIDYHSVKGEQQIYLALAEPEKWVSIIKKTMALKLIERRGYNGAKPESPNDS